MKHIVCYSGGLSSAKVAMNVSKKFGSENVILLNHDINSWVEDEDVKRFKKEVAANLGIEITYSNFENKEIPEIPDQFDLCEAVGGFKFGIKQVICTHRLKTLPFQKYLNEKFPVKEGEIRKDLIIYYGFDINEKNRIIRRSGILGNMGYKSDYPIALWEDFDHDIVAKNGINPPLQYSEFKHANCKGCLKAGKQHWYLVYCTRPDIWERAKLSEERIGHSILKNEFLEELEEDFEKMKELGVKPTEHINQRKFWEDAKKIIQNKFQLKISYDIKPCECVF